jgi:hypothetical protein
MTQKKRMRAKVGGAGKKKKKKKKQKKKERRKKERKRKKVNAAEPVSASPLHIACAA